MFDLGKMGILLEVLGFTKKKLTDAPFMGCNHTTMVQARDELFLPVFDPCFIEVRRPPQLKAKSNGGRQKTLCGCGWPTKHHSGLQTKEPLPQSGSRAEFPKAYHRFLNRQKLVSMSKMDRAPVHGSPASLLAFVSGGTGSLKKHKPKTREVLSTALEQGRR